jgi:hypothetical protein
MQITRLELEAVLQKVIPNLWFEDEKKFRLPLPRVLEAAAIHLFMARESDSEEALLIRAALFELELKGHLSFAGV